MGGSIELSADVAADLRAAADDHGYDDPEAFLEWLLANGQDREDLSERLATVEQRLDDLEARVEDQNGTDLDDRAVLDVIDGALGDPQGANDTEVSAAISEVEQNGGS